MRSRVLLITGAPGVGKTTLLKELVKILETSDTDFKGFLTIEVRDIKGSRIGFNLIPLNLKDSLKEIPFARKPRYIAELRGPKIERFGSYLVDVSVFSKFIDSLWSELRSSSGDLVVIIDEIAPMELKADNFREFIKWLIYESSFPLVATVKEKGRGLILKLKEEFPVIHIKRKLSEDEKRIILKNLLEVIGKELRYDR